MSCPWEFKQTIRYCNTCIFIKCITSVPLSCQKSAKLRTSRENHLFQNEGLSNMAVTDNNKNDEKHIIDYDAGKYLSLLLLIYEVRFLEQQ